MDYLLLILATWRISCLLLYEEGPFDIFTRLRNLIGIYEELDSEGDTQQYIDPDKSNFLTALFSCLYCLSIWLGFGFAILYFTFPNIAIYIATPFAISAGAVLIDNLSDGG